MTSHRFGVIVIAAALPLLMQQVSLALADSVTKAEREGILSLHNAYRDHHCVPALSWSAELAAAAQKWADKCWIGHDKNLGHIGENLAWGGDRSASSAVDAWYKEVDQYNYAKPGFTAGTGHFTQMVWRDTKQIGCGVAKCYLGAVRLWVCRYGPTGNWAGKYPQNVSKRCK